MTICKELCSWSAIFGLLLISASPTSGRADERGQPPDVAHTRSPAVAKPLSAQDGDAVRDYVGRRCTLTFLDGSTRVGVVTQVEPGAWIKLATPSGPDETLSWRFLAGVSPAEPFPATELPAPVPSAINPWLRHRGRRLAIYLRSGLVRRGTVRDLLPGQWLKLHTDEGADENIAWVDIESLKVARPIAAAAAPGTALDAASRPAEAPPTAEQPAPPKTPPAPVPTGAVRGKCTVDTPHCRFVLADGSVVIGRLVDVRPGQSRTLRMSVGTTRELPWKEVTSTEAIDAATATLAATSPSYPTRTLTTGNGSSPSMGKSDGVSLLVIGGIGVAVGLFSGLYAGIASALLSAGPACIEPSSAGCNSGSNRTPDYSPIVAPATISGVSLLIGGALVAGGIVLLGSDDKPAKRRR